MSNSAEPPRRGLEFCCVAGFNAFGQLGGCGGYTDDNDGKDDDNIDNNNTTTTTTITTTTTPPTPSPNQHTFRPLPNPSSPPDSEPVTPLFASWSSTALVACSTRRVRSLGQQKLSSGVSVGTDGCGAGGLEAFGDHGGVRGVLDTAGGRLYWVSEIGGVGVGGGGGSGSIEEGGGLMIDVTDEASPALGHIALAPGSERLAVSFAQAPGGKLTHIAEFTSAENFLTWFKDPSGEGKYPDRHFMLPGRAKQLVANTATFLVLMEDGGVFSWGDGRFRTLGRGIVGEGAVGAGEPGVVEALGGLGIAKVACGGWMSAAVSGDGALFLWGRAGVGAIGCLGGVGVGEVALVELLAEGGEVLDVVDVGVGDGHVAAVTADGGLWVVGGNCNGQLGLGDEGREFVAEWTVVPALRGVRRVVCGPLATFVWVGEGGCVPTGV
ncbi:hypothetical protein LTR08_000901 [Meristemomyces frigidus]|nr:hypothetical protein LTR08_000901 [Meristemomyces frigidus]